MSEERKEQEVRKSLKGIHIAGGCTLAVVLILAWFAVDRSPPIKFLDGGLWPQEVDDGDGLTVMRSIEWLKFDCTNLVTGYVQDANGVQDKQANFSAPVPDKETCFKATAERDAKAGIKRDRPTCIVNSRSAPPVRGIRTTKRNGPGSGTAQGAATYHATVDLQCGMLGKLMTPIQVVAPPLSFVVK